MYAIRSYYESGSWFAYGDIKVGQGRDAAKAWLVENPAFRAEIRERLRAALGMVEPAVGITNGEVVEEV